MIPPSSIQHISIDRSRFGTLCWRPTEDEMKANSALPCARHFSGEIVELARPDCFRLRPQACLRTCAASPLPSTGWSRLTATCVEPDLLFLNVSPFPRRAIRTRVLPALVRGAQRLSRRPVTVHGGLPESRGYRGDEAYLHQYLKPVEPYLSSRRSVPSPCTSRRRSHFDDEAFHDRLVALRANVGDSTKDVQLGHIAGRRAGRDLVAHGAVAVHGSLCPVS